MLEARERVVGRVRAVADDAARVEDRARVDHRVAGLDAAADAVDDASGHGLPSRKRGELSFAKTSITGAPKPIVIRIFVPAAASFSASALLTQSLFGRCTSSGMPISTAAFMAGELTACT